MAVLNGWRQVRCYSARSRSLRTTSGSPTDRRMGAPGARGDHRCVAVDGQAHVMQQFHKRRGLRDGTGFPALDAVLAWAAWSPPGGRSTDRAVARRAPCTEGGPPGGGVHCSSLRDAVNRVDRRTASIVGDDRPVPADAADGSDALAVQSSLSVMTFSPPSTAPWRAGRRRPDRAGSRDGHGDQRVAGALRLPWPGALPGGRRHPPGRGSLAPSVSSTASTSPPDRWREPMSP